jgi:MFS superfamily sulfate permease-like transporter
MNQHSTDANAGQSSATSLRFDVIAGLTAAAVVLPNGAR